jgi:hypothetical protein
MPKLFKQYFMMISASLCGVISQKTITFIITTVGTTNSHNILTAGSYRRQDKLPLSYKNQELTCFIFCQNTTSLDSVHITSVHGFMMLLRYMFWPRHS